MGFAGEKIAGLRQNIYFQPEKVGGQLPALPNRLRRLWIKHRPRPTFLKNDNMKFSIIIFTRAKLASAGISHRRVSVCLSVCLSVCVSVALRYCNN